MLITLVPDELHEGMYAAKATIPGRVTSWTETTYNDDGTVASTTSSIGGESQSVYDSAGRIIQSISPDGTSTETLYNDAGEAALTTDRHVIGQSAYDTRTTRTILGDGQE